MSQKRIDWPFWIVMMIFGGAILIGVAEWVITLLAKLAIIGCSVP